MATVTGTNGNDVISAATLPQGTTATDDQIFAFAGNDVILRSLGNDSIDGGEGFDAIDYTDSTNRIVLSLANGTLREFDAAGQLRKADRIYAVEEFRTGIGDDSLTGSGADEVFAPGRGNDAIAGGEGADTLSYAVATGRVFVDLVAGLARDWGAGQDSFTGIEGARGGQANDVLLGGADFALLRGNAGADTLVSGWNGQGAPRGSTGIDYALDPAGVLVDLAAGRATDGTGATDTLLGSFRTVVGSAFADTLRGDANDNVFRPRGGADVVDGGAGFDRMDWRDEAAADPDGDGFVVTASLAANGSGSARDSSGALDSFTGIEWLRGSFFADALTATGRGGLGFGGLFLSHPQPFELEGWAGDDLLGGTPGTGVVARYGAEDGSIVADLAAGFVLDGFGYRDLLVGIWGIAGSAFADVIMLSAANDYARPGAGNDMVDGRAGVDTVDYLGAPAGVLVDLAAGTAADGFGGTDTLRDIEAAGGSAFADTLLGDAGANWFLPQGGDDAIDGRDGSDTVAYFQSAAGVVVDLAAGIATGDGSDTLASIENAVGSQFADTLRGGAGPNALYGAGGDDVLDGGQGDDLLDGGAGLDTAFYTAAASRIVLDLSLAAPQNTLGAGIDTLVGIEAIIATRFNDTLTGGAGNDRLVAMDGADYANGAGGDDIIEGGLGDDTLYGGSGRDTASFLLAAGPVVVSLLLQYTRQDTLGAGRDYLSGFENLVGGAGADTLTGDQAANTLDGWFGNDTLDGGAGDDTLHGGFLLAPELPGGAVPTDDDTLVGGTGIDTVTYDGLGPETRYAGLGLAPGVGVTVSLLAQGAAQDTLGAGADTLIGIENLTGSRFADRLTGDALNNILRGLDGDDVLEGGLGDDLLDGGPGLDLASYAGSLAAVTVYLGASSSTGAAGIDYFNGIEGLRGSAFADTLVGDAGPNLLEGGAGNDRLFGQAGDDALRGGAGDDDLNGGDGADTADFSDATLTARVVLGSGGRVDSINYGRDLYIGIENIAGGSARDFLTGDGNANRIAGNAGADIIAGLAGDDTLLGGAGDDDITGGLGADRIEAGQGFDIVRYGAAAESRAAAADRIEQFTIVGLDFDRIGFENAADALFPGLTPVAIALAAPVSIVAAATLDDLVAQLPALVPSADGVLVLTQVAVQHGAVAGTWLVASDTVAAFDPAADMLVGIAFAAGSGTTLLAGNFFLF
jgi:Ca2+-binding RTX toxin-like protein